VKPLPAALPCGALLLLAVLCASIADCFVLTFRAIARASKPEWSELACR